MAVTKVEQRARNPDRQIDRRAIDDFIEVHVSAVAAGVASTWRGLCNPWSNRNATQHRPQRNRVVRQMFRRFFRSRHAVFPIEMPAHVLESVLHLGGPVAVETAANDSVVTDRPIAIQT